MKFSCGECQAKYQIPDERVAGRKLKIRCRKCGAAISLRGDPTVEGIAGIPVAPTTTEWHVSIEGEQHGPYATEQMASMLRAGQLGWEAHVWREGFGDWKTADESDTLVHAVAALSSAGSSAGPTSGIAPYDDDEMPTRMKATAVEDEEPTRMAVNAPVIGQPHALAPQARSTFAARASAVRTSSYGSAPPAGYTSMPPAVVMPPPALGANVRQLPVPRSPRVSAAQAMTAERNEDSVLFSANNIVPSSTQQQSASPRAGYAGGEGSGLIDIRALAALAHSHRQTVQPQSASPYASASANPAATMPPSYSSPSYSTRADEPLPAIAHQAGTFGRIDSLSPIERAPGRGSSAVPIAILAGSAMIATAAFLAVYLTQQPAPVPTAVSAPVLAAEPTTAPTAVVLPTSPPADPEPAVLAAVAPSEAKGAAAEAPSEPAAEEPATPSAAPSHARGKKAAAGRSAKIATVAKSEKSADKIEKPAKADKASSAAKTADEPAAEKEKPSIDDLLLDDPKPAPAAVAAEPAKAKESSKSRSIDDLLDGATDKKQGAAAAPAADSSLPDAPSRDDVKTAMHAVEGDVKACADGQNLAEPTATVAITVIGATGHVQSVRVTGNQGAVGTCIARAVRAASFPKFAKSQMTINFPFKLK